MCEIECLFFPVSAAVTVSHPAASSTGPVVSPPTASVTANGQDSQTTSSAAPLDSQAPVAGKPHPSLYLEDKPSTMQCTASDVMLSCATGCLEINDLRAVQRAVWDARSKWYDVGVELLVSPDTLDVIEEDKRGVCDTCFREMLKEWLRRPKPRPTWVELAEALRAPTIGYGHLADKLPPQST